MPADVVEHADAETVRPSHEERWFLDACARVRAVVLLAGSVRPSDLSRCINRSLLDLPVEPGRSVLALWQEHVDRLAAAAELPRLPLRVIIDKSGREPSSPVALPRVELSVERDAAEFRGTGGILRDLALHYAPDDLLLVGNAAQILVEPLTSLASDLLATRASVGLIGHQDGTPGGLFLVKRSVLTAAGDVGFLDFKEQFLPRLAAAGHDVRVVGREHASGLPVRTLDGYLGGLLAYYRLKAGRPAAGDPFAEDWSPTYAIVEPGAHVDPAATVHDSVVLAGGRLERGAVAVRSVIGPEGFVRAGQTIAGQIIGVSRERTVRRPS